MLIEDLQSAAADYIGVLEASRAHTSRSEDRSAYERHLAHAASIAAAAIRGDLARLRVLVAEERRDFGWGYLSEQVGREAESAFERFAERVEHSAV